MIRPSMAEAAGTMTPIAVGVTAFLVAFSHSRSTMPYTPKDIQARLTKFK
jgi:hypothetical protein